jgi:cytochrome c1
MNTKNTMRFLLALVLGSVLCGRAALAADKTYQVTGPILEVTDTTIVVQKGKEKWEIARTKDTKVTGELKVGAKVTIQYTMTAASIEAKGDGKADAKADAKAEKPAKK